MENKRLLALYAIAALAIHTTITPSDIASKVTFSEKTLNLFGKYPYASLILGGAVFSGCASICAMGLTKYRLSYHQDHKDAWIKNKITKFKLKKDAWIDNEIKKSKVKEDALNVAKREINSYQLPNRHTLRDFQGVQRAKNLIEHFIKKNESAHTYECLSKQYDQNTPAPTLGDLSKQYDQEMVPSINRAGIACFNTGLSLTALSVYCLWHFEGLRSLVGILSRN